MASPTQLFRRPRLAAASLAIALSAASIAACGSDESAQDRYCEAGESLSASVAALFELDVVAEGTNGLRSALEDVESSLTELRESASDAASDEVDALNDAVGELNDALSAAGDSLTADNATGVVGAIGGVRTAFAAIGDTLTDC